MADSPQNSPTAERQYSPAVQRLAERYGMTPDAIENIISGTGVTPTTPVGGTMPPTPQASLPRQRSVPPVSRPKNGPGLPIALGIVLLAALALALSFKKGCFRQRTPDDFLRPNIADTLLHQDSVATTQASQPPIDPSQVEPPRVPPEALVVPREAPKGTTGPASTAGATTMKEAVKASRKVPSHRTRPRPVLTTSSYLDAQERLAELHAGGHTKAHVVAKGSGDTRTYSVYSR